MAATAAINLLVHSLFWHAMTLAEPAGLAALYLLELVMASVEGTLYRLNCDLRWRLG
jgi:hypothetical protein